MDIFLKQFQDEHNRKGRVEQFFESDLFSQSNDKPIIFDLEIGCGHGHWLNAYSDAHLDTICVGIDLISKRILRSNNKKFNNKRKNISFFKAEANEFLLYKPSNYRIRNTFILFPDPWPKKKHHKRRLIQENFLSLLRQNTLQDSLIFFRTDNVDYHDWTIQKFEGSKSWEIIDLPWPFEHESYFQNLLPNYNSIISRAL